MPAALNFLDGTSKNSTAILQYLGEDLIPQAVRVMNNQTLPLAVVLFPGDALPTNQRNLTDVRTRIGLLLEYEFAKAVTASLPTAAKEQHVVLTYVVANQFPDLAFRSDDGRIGIRFEVKAIQTIAEEKSANFSTLIKDIRKGTDFVVVLLWEWKQHGSRSNKFPHIDNFFVMDAYQLAQMRDCYWLNRPPHGLKSARQGFDLTFAVNARGDSYNKEEGNYGKLMRIFDRKYETYLPDAVRQGQTLQTYYLFSEEATRLGLKQIGQEIAAEASDRSPSVISEATLPVCFSAEQSGSRLLIMGDRAMPRKQQTIETMQANGASLALLLNEKFSWKVCNERGETVCDGKKPEGAKRWVKEEWRTVISPHLF